MTNEMILLGLLVIGIWSLVILFGLTSRRVADKIGVWGDRFILQTLPGCWAKKLVVLRHYPFFI